MVSIFVLVLWGPAADEHGGRARRAHGEYSPKIVGGFMDESSRPECQERSKAEAKQPMCCLEDCFPLEHPLSSHWEWVAASITLLLCVLAVALLVLVR